MLQNTGRGSIAISYSDPFTNPDMPAEQEMHTGAVATVGGGGAAIGASAATVIDTNPVLGLVLAFRAGLVISGGLFLLYSRLSSSPGNSSV